jgi:hypothetical protein
MSFEGSNSTKIVLDDNDVEKNIGVQPNTVYHRTNGTHAWYLSGTESAGMLDPGAGGFVLATLTQGATATTSVGTFRAQAFTPTSNRNQKTGFRALSGKAIRAKVAQLPVMKWSYKNEADRGITHIGPVAQDFQRLFNVGYDDKSISWYDEFSLANRVASGIIRESPGRFQPPVACARGRPATLGPGCTAVADGLTVRTSRERTCCEKEASFP